MLRVMPEDKVMVELSRLINEYKKTQHDVAGQIVMAFPAGVPIASTWEGQVDPILIGAISAAVKLTFQHLCDNLKRGILQRLFINSENGKVIIQNTGPKAILTTIMNFDADVHRVGFTMGGLAIKIEKLLKNWTMK